MIAQGGNGKGYNAQAVIEVFAEISLPNLVLQIPVSGGHHPHIDPYRLFPAHRANLEVLQNTQQLGLQMQGHLANLIKKNSAAVGLLKGAAPGASGAGKGPTGVTKKFAFQKLFRQGCGINRHKGAGGAGAFSVDGLGQMLFSHPGLAKQEQHGVARCHLLHLVHKNLHHLAGGTKVAKLRLHAALTIKLVKGPELTTGLQDALHGLGQILQGDAGVQNNIGPGRHDLGMLLGRIGMV